MGSRLVVLLALLAIIGIGGTRNYQRNLAEGDAKEGPFSTYSDEAIDSLIEAYEAEVEVYTQAFQKTASQKLESQASAHMDARIREFERVQGNSRKTRRLVTELAKRQVALEQLQTEKSRRGTGGVKLFFKRLLSLPG
ncbi:MAG: hypothetical protein V3T01_11825 [Myxococcota bacterium]